MSSAAVRALQPKRGIASSLGLFSSPEKQTFVFSLLLIALTLVLYNPANHFSFINYDDNRYVYENVHVRSGLTWTTVKWAFTSFEEANWHPLTWLSHIFDAQLFRMNPAGHHLTSVLLHAVNVVLLFLLLGRSTGRTGPSLFVAALFAVHPINVESVAWIAERKNVLSTMFFLLTIGAYGWYALKPGWKRYLAVTGLLACGLASKPMLVTVPFVLLLLDYWPLHRIRGWSPPSDSLAIEQFKVGRVVLEKLPLLLLATASSVITIRAQRAAGAVGTLPFPFAARLQNGIFSYAMYLCKTFWPSHLTLFYPYSSHPLSSWKITAAAMLLVTISAAVLRLRSRGYLLTGWLWFLGTLVPVIGVIQVGNQAMADRYAYIPLMGIFVMIAWSASDLAREREWGSAAPVFLAVCGVVILSVAAYRQIGYWRDSITLWTHAIQVTQQNYVAEENLGVALTQLNRYDEAYPFFVRAAQHEPNDPIARVNIGAYLRQHGRLREAISQYELAVRLAEEPGLLSTTHSNLGTAYSDVGDYLKSRINFQEALRLNPNQAGAWQGLAFLAQKQGNIDQAITYFARAAELSPSGQGYLQLAGALEAANRHAEARAAYEQALRLEPGLTQQRTERSPESR
ncbi:MAG TPA: tetratricopeptide repeat protein [Candidatus Sulfotelmatobacter sp.]